MTGKRVSREEQMASYLVSDAWERWQKDYPVPTTWKENPHSKARPQPRQVQNGKRAKNYCSGVRGKAHVETRQGIKSLPERYK